MFGCGMLLGPHRCHMYMHCEAGVAPRDGGRGAAGGVERMQMATRHRFRKPVRCVVRHAGVPSPNTIKT